MKKAILPLLIAALVLAAGCAQENPVQPQPAPTEVGVPEEGVKTFSLEGKNFRFTMDGKESPDLKVKQGDKVRIEFTSTDGLHDWTIDEFSARTEQVRKGDTSTVEFVADKKGIFEYYCSVGQHRAQGMTGSLIVE